MNILSEEWKEMKSQIKFKLFKKQIRLDVAKYSFANRVCDRWNRLPEDVVSSSSVNLFQGRLDNNLGKVEEFK